MHRNIIEGEANHIGDTANDSYLSSRQPLLQQTSSLTTTTHSLRDDHTDNNSNNISNNLNQTLPLLAPNDDISKPSMDFHNLQLIPTFEHEFNDSEHSVNRSMSTVNKSIGQVSVEVLQCLGLPLGNDPKTSLTGAASATSSSSSSNSSNALPFALVVCGDYAFQTDCGMQS